MKSAKNLLIPFIVMVLLGIGVLVFYLVDRSWKEPEGPTKNNTTDLLYVSPVDFASISIFHKENNIDVKIDKKALSNGSSSYVYLGNDKGEDRYSQSKISDFVSTMTSFVGCSLVTEKSDLAQFGLNDPKYVVTIYKTDGTANTVLIGNLSPDPEYCYVCAKGSTSVYLVNSNKYTYASKVAKDFIDSRIIDISMSDLNSVRLVRKKDSIDVFANCYYNSSDEQSSFKFVTPFEISSSEFFDRLIEHICCLEALEYEDVTFENLSKYGLSSPEITIVLKTNDSREYSFVFSSVRNGYYYGRLNSAGKIFKIESERLTSIESPLLVLLNNYFFYNTCDNIDSIECSSPEKKFNMKLDVAKDGAISDDYSIVTLDGRNAKVTSSSGRSYAAMLYETIFCINIGGIDTDAKIDSSAVPVTTITIFDRNHSSVVYSFYKRDHDSYYMCKNGQYTKFYVYGRELYNDGGTNTYDYGLWPAYEILTKAITEQINGVYDIPEKQ